MTDIDKFHFGQNYEAYRLLGAQYTPDKTTFRVWAPHAIKISVVGDFNDWQNDRNPMIKISQGGIWETTIPGLKEYTTYKYAVYGSDHQWVLKADPFAFHSELRPATGSKIYDLKDNPFTDHNWLKKRSKILPYGGYNGPLNIYEVNLSTWRRYPDGNCYDYQKLGQELADYASDMGYTHIEIMPISEYPFDGSWGYQVTGFYSITSRFGTPHDFKVFVNTLHKKGIGVIVDWVPGHFCKDQHGLANFDGQPLYEPDDPLVREHKGWGTCSFDYSCYEVCSFLISNAVYLIKEYHIDGLRVDAVTSILYLDYDRNPGEWRVNREGGNINLEALNFIKTLNSYIHQNFPGVLMIAEESTTFDKITVDPFWGGLGFDYKWNMGWMNDTLRYLKTDPLFRQYHHNLLTFQLTYAFSEKYLLPLSHDEVVHGKLSLINRVPGDYDQKFLGLKSYLMYLMSHPGKKITFMGIDIAQFIEWNDTKELDWLLLAYPKHQEHQQFVKKLNHFYLQEKALYELDHSWDGFQWINADDQGRNVISYARISKSGKKLIVIINFSYQDWPKYLIPLEKGTYRVVLSSSDQINGGFSNLENQLFTVKDGSLEIDLPSNTSLYLKKEKKHV